jgi:hypothetical protein
MNETTINDTTTDNTNLDYQLIINRSEKYNEENSLLFSYEKHLSGSCNCKKNNKICFANLTTEQKIIDFNNFKNFKNNSLLLKCLYNVVLSDTNSRKSKAGSVFENELERIFIEHKINYAKQVLITHDGIINLKGFSKLNSKKKGHRVDFMIPPPLNNTHIDTYKGEIISAKTTFRERYLEDIQYRGKPNSRLVFISMEELDNEEIKPAISIKIDSDKKNLTNFISEIKAKYFE